MRQFAGFGTAEETNERLPLPARARADRALDGVRHALADGPRLRPPAVAGRGRARGRGDRHAPGHGDAVRRDPARRGQRVDDDQRAGARSCSRSTSSRPSARGSPPDRLAGTIQTDILKEYIAQKEWCFPVDPAMRLVDRHDRVVLGAHAALASDLDQRLPHPRGRLDRGAGARVHAQGRPHLRRARGRARPRRRRLRAAAELLLQRPHRLLRGDRQVPGGAADLGARAARHVRRAEPSARC